MKSLKQVSEIGCNTIKNRQKPGICLAAKARICLCQRSSQYSQYHQKARLQQIPVPVMQCQLQKKATKIHLSWLEAGSK
ncbi:hypothetical protein [Undibacterium pigrum]|uniref:hypothetical protein n=1 Tax=Undibacterium pigrum TaxID=401470 RepID=UPI0011B5A812|nr:hypothetical protein [Undibacterium pigrum]